jgi:hypothetical protein
MLTKEEARRMLLRDAERQNQLAVTFGARFAWPRRGYACDDTCTTDCGHCKGVHTDEARFGPKGRNDHV